MNRYSEGLFRDLREQYPHPIKTPRNERGEPTIPPPWDYCVGGALTRAFGLCAYADPSWDLPAAEPGRAGMNDEQKAPRTNATRVVGTFPDSKLIATLLQRVNPGLTPEMARWFARRITQKNDTGNFETAWATLEDAFEWAERWTPTDDIELAAVLRAST